MPKTLVEPRKKRIVYVDETVDTAVQLLLADAMRGRVQYGTWSDLINACLRRWLTDQGVRLS